MNNLLALCVVVAFGCSGGQKVGDGKGSGGSDTGDGSGSGSASVVAVDEPITRDECGQMMGHILDVGVAALPVEERPAPERIEEIRKGMVEKEEDMQKCLAFDREVFVCVMKAGDPPTLEACLGAE
jgi:hypothetical protein